MCCHARYSILSCASSLTTSCHHPFSHLGFRIVFHIGGVSAERCAADEALVSEEMPIGSSDGKMGLPHYHCHCSQQNIKYEEMNCSATSRSMRCNWLKWATVKPESFHRLMGSFDLRLNQKAYNSDSNSSSRVGAGRTARRFKLAFDISRMVSNQYSKD